MPPNPYRGLHVFQEADVDYFFGRTAATDLLVQAVNRQPLVAVIGASGSGKSSLVFAGLIPRLRQSKQWLIVCCRPKDQPFYQLALALVQFFYTDPLERAEKLSRFHHGLQSGEILLKYIVDSSLLDKPDQRLLLVIDQFEELYTLNPPAVQTAFIDCLLELIPLTPPTTLTSTVVLTLRADFMNQALSHAQFAQALNTYPSQMLGPMTVAELRTVIEQPAAQQGMALEEGLTDRILKELEDAPGYLPLLEFALTQLWEQHLTHAAYDAMGGVKQALAHHADTVCQQLPPTQQSHLRRVMVQLVRPGEGTEDTRQVATRQQVGESNWLLIQELANKRLVVTKFDEETQQETVEVVHEALIRHWQPLREWLTQDRNFRLWQNDLRHNLASWEQTGKDEGALLRGARLAEALEKSQERQAELSIPEQAYIQASVVLQAQEIKRKKQLQRRIMSGLVSFLIIVLVLAGVAGWQQV